MICIVLALTGTISAVAASLEDDEKDCAEQLTNLAACIPYVSGTAKQPTKECCDDTAKLKAAKPKCLCVLIKESTDPSMGLPINTTLALQMPGACNIDAKVSDCPTLLNIPADSPDAKIFKVASEDSSTASTANSPSDSSTASSKSPPSSAATASDNTTTSLNSNSGAKVSSTIFLLMGLASISLIFI
ncbi:protein yls3 [Phtheirospermum japonicum]|uniref:Protein yls3 n=1 Tax=Phtheirospermum japonicum TaxID=374723 RepID=A0A830C9K5_9LAMI|nr:protein yls3 [Phtheirospermum japonicum]